MFDEIIKTFRKLPWYLRNRYTLTLAAFAVWMIFFDQNNVFSQIKKSRELNHLEEKKAFYTDQIEQVTQDKKDLFSSPESIEKYAREQYLMKKDNEDIYVIQ